MTQEDIIKELEAMEAKWQKEQKEYDTIEPTEYNNGYDKGKVSAYDATLYDLQQLLTKIKNNEAT